LAARLAAGPWRRIAPTPRVIPVIAVVVTAPATVTIILIVTEREHIARVGVPGSVTARPRIVVVVSVAVAIGLIGAGETLVRRIVAVSVTARIIVAAFIVFAGSIAGPGRIIAGGEAGRVRIGDTAG